jgi:IstB-like ATP binding protein
VEVAARSANAVQTRIRNAGFRVLKDFDTFDFSAVPSLNKPKVLELARGEWLNERSNACLIGAPGTGKTHVAIALALAACRQGKRVRFVTAGTLVTLLDLRAMMPPLSKGLILRRRGIGPIAAGFVSGNLAPGFSVIGPSVIAFSIPGGGWSRKLPSSPWAMRSWSTCRRNAALLPHAPSRYVARSAGSAMSRAAAKMDRSLMVGSIGFCTESRTYQCAICAKSSPRKCESVRVQFLV